RACKAWARVTGRSLALRAFECRAYRQSGTAEIDRRRPKMRPTFFRRARGRPGLLTLATQVFATGWLLKRFGTGMAAGALPAVYVVGFAALAFVTSVTAVVIFQVAQRWMNFAVANPARQVFFTVVERGEKYKAKNLIDVVIYRGSDALYGWVFDLLQAAGL